MRLWGVTSQDFLVRLLHFGFRVQVGARVGTAFDLLGAEGCGSMRAWGLRVSWGFGLGASGFRKGRSLHCQGLGSPNSPQST